MEARVIVRTSGEVDVTGVSTSVPWWSFTKTALAMALVRLAEQGKVNLDEPVAGKPYTPFQLLRHEAGLPDYGSLASYHNDVEARREPWPVDYLLKETKSDELLFRPGHGWSYSNIGYREIAQLIERTSDRPLNDALGDIVFIPAGITSARLATNPADLAEVSMGDADGYHPGWVYHGLVVGTAIDAARLLKTLLTGDFTGKSWLARMLDGRSLPQFRSEVHPDPAYGLGLMLSATNPLAHPVGHGGSGPGSRIAVYTQQGTGCAVWAATSSGVNPEVEAFQILHHEGD
jgi:CubicO group peptidase (beta-lactamase class C family)